MSNNNFPTKEQVTRLREQYPEGTRLVLTADLEDPAPIAVGTRGACKGVDDAGQIMMSWDTGRGLSLIAGKDSFRKLTKAERIREEARKVAATGRTNMFDMKAAFEIAVELGCDAFADFCFLRSNDYGKFILSGELPDDIEEDEI